MGWTIQFTVRGLDSPNRNIRNDWVGPKTVDAKKAEVLPRTGLNCQPLDIIVMNDHNV